MSAPKRILISRTDRLGDVLLSLHTVRMLRQALPHYEIDLLARTALQPLLTPLMSQWQVSLVPWESFDSSLLPRYGAAVCLFDEPKLLSQLRSSGVKLRVGNYSKLRSFLLLSHGIRQRRGLGRLNEAQYNLELGKLLLGVLGAETFYSPEPIQLPPGPDAQTEASQALKKLGVEKGESYWVVHPGMGGSALNLSASGYSKLLNDLEKEQEGPLIVSLGPAPADLNIVEKLVDRRPDLRVLPRVSVPALAEVFRGSKLVVAPSTGPLHLAHYVGASTLGVFSPVRSHHPNRWGPWGGTGHSQILVPPFACPGTKTCLGKRCPHYFCMEQLAAAPIRLPIFEQSV